MLEKYPSLNGLRAVSIVMVILGHLSMFAEIPMKTSFFILKPFYSLITDGNLGVTIFFVISGFLITSILLNEEKRTGTISLKNFFLKRTLRIFPAYYFMLLVYFVLSKLQLIEISNASWLTSLTYTKYLNWRLDWHTAHAWSLSVEEQFYLLWPFIFLLKKNIRFGFALITFFSVALLKYYLIYHHLQTFDAMHILQRIDSIAIGCIFALKKEWIIKQFTGKWNAIAFVSFLLLLALRYVFLIKTPFTLVNAFLFFASQTFSSIGSILVAILVMYFVFGTKNIFYKWLNTSWMNFIGILSYSIYLWQQIFVLNYTQFPFNFPFNIVCLFIVALFSYYIIEKPFLKIKSKIVTN